MKPLLARRLHYWRISAACSALGTPGIRPFDWDLSPVAYMKAARMIEKWIFRFGGIPADGPAGRVAYATRPACRLFTPDGAQVASPQSLILRWSNANLPKLNSPQPPHNLRSLIKNLEHPPQWHVRKKLERSTPWETREDGCSRLHIEWIANGFTAVCFWTVPRRLIAGLESPTRFSLTAGLCLTRLSPNRCLAGLLPREEMSDAANRN